MSEITYRAAAPNDYEKTIGLTSKYINDEPEYLEYMRSIHDALGESSLGVLAFDGDKIVGAAFVEKGPHLTGNRTDFFDEIKKDFDDEEIWSGAIVVVDKDYRKKKIGAAMQLRVQEAIIKAGGKHLLLEIWVHPDGIAPSDGTVHLAPSYTEYGTVKNFYDIPALAGHVCQICGPHCKCSARISLLHLDGGADPAMDISYRRIRKDDFDKSVVLAKKMINSEDAFGEVIRELYEHIGGGVEGTIALNGLGDAVGLMYCVRGMELTGNRTDYFERIKNDIGGDKIWTGRLIVVDSKYQGRKISRVLNERAFSTLRGMGVKHLLVEIWVRPDGYMPGVSGLHIAPSFTDYGDVKRFYAEIPGSDRHVCPVCGEDCKCSAKIAVMHLCEKE